MKLKSVVVASTVCLLGLGTSSAFASASSKSNSRADMQKLQARSSLIEATLNQNEGSILAAKPYLANDWTKRITLSGELNVDGKWRTKHGPSGSAGEESGLNPSLFQSRSYTDIYLNNSQLDADIMVNNWVQAHTSLTGRDPIHVNERYRSAVNDNAPINLDEAYVTVGHLDTYPVYMTAGRQYMPFGVYDRHAIQPTLTQYLAQTQGTAAKVGMVFPMGVQTSFYAFRGDNRSSGSTYYVNTYGAEIGIANHDNVGGMPLGYKLSVGWLSNMAQSNWIASAVNGTGLTGKDSVSGLSVDGKLMSGPFALRANYVQTLSRFETSVVSMNEAYGKLNHDHPWAYGIAGDYTFNVMDYENMFSLNFQQSGDAQGLGIPQVRYGATYSVGVAKDTTVSFLLSQDRNYSRSKAITPIRDATEAAIRLSVDF
jgi:hypothetical protein